ncbi:MAG: hypothetical protein LBL72_01120 [Candidatus Accumulibacter sp.]|jgi:hypothetical protein|nr:hypothetical protein [Accumulibacter sp.]
MSENSISPEEERLIHFKRIDAEISKIFTENEKMRIEIGKIIAETTKLQTESKWHPFVATAAVFGAALALVKFLA